VPKIEANKSHWLSVSEEFFKSDFETPKQFYEHFVDSCVLYYELGKRLIAAEVEPSTASWAQDFTDGEVAAMVNARAYRLMDEAFREDVANGNQSQLEELISDYRQYLEQEGE
jgi:hypothetical protein